MRSFLYFIILVVLLGSILLAVNLLLAPHVPYKEKKTPFECGYHSFNQTRFPIEIKPLIFALMFVIFDVELVSAFPYVVSSVANERFGFVIFIIFVVILCVGFIFELGKGALTIESRQSKDMLEKTNSFNNSVYDSSMVKVNSLIVLPKLPNLLDMLSIFRCLEQYVCIKFVEIMFIIKVNFYDNPSQSY